MRKVIVCNIVSVDGFYAAPDGNPLVLNMDAAFDAYNRERISSADLVLLGANSFRMFSGFWPYVADAPAEPDGAGPSEDNREMSRVYNRLPKIVGSDSLAVDDTNAWHGTTTVVSRSKLAGRLATLKEEGDGDIVVFASHVMWNALLDDGLVDEIHFVVSPNPLGNGVDVFDGEHRLSLLGTRTFEGSDNVLLRYAPTA
jgi:dihydrofolate reductase